MPILGQTRTKHDRKNNTCPLQLLNPNPPLQVSQPSSCSGKKPGIPGFPTSLCMPFFLLEMPFHLSFGYHVLAFYVQYLSLDSIKLPSFLLILGSISVDFPSLLTDEKMILYSWGKRKASSSHFSKILLTPSNFPVDGT